MKKSPGEEDQVSTHKISMNVKKNEEENQCPIVGVTSIEHPMSKNLIN